MLLDSSVNVYYVLAEIIIMLLQLYDKQTPPFSRSTLHNINTEGILYEPTVVSSPGFSPENDVYKIGNMTRDEKNDKLLEVLLSRTNAERQSIVRNYQKLFNKSILLEISDINMRSMKLFIQDMLTDTSMLLADELNKAMKTSDLQLVTSILIDFWGDEFNQVESVYRIYSNESIWQHINNSFGVTVKNILRCTVMTRKHEQKLDYPIKGKGGKRIVETGLVTKIHEILTRKLATKEYTAQSLEKLFCLLYPFEMEMLNKQFNEKTTGKDLSAFIENNTNGLMRDVLIAMLNHSVNKPMYFATIIHDAIHKNQTNTSTVHRLLISRSEIDLYTINKEYKVKYGKYLLDDVKKTFDGIYGKFLAKLLQNQELPKIF
ncbi:Annexin A10 [Schistosoma japonicum]|nr:Annexin A10 [Schistosoma japonicum]